MSKRLTIAFVILVTLVATASFSAEPTPLLIDTDMALDDVRALALIFSAPNLKVKAVVTTDGSADPAAGARNVLAILDHLGVGDVEVGVGQPRIEDIPEWRAMSDTMGWADIEVTEEKINALRDSCRVIQRVLEETDRPLVYVCLGPMSNLARVITDYPELRKNIESVYYYGSGPGAIREGWNTECDPQAAARVFGSGIRVNTFHPRSSDLLVFDTVMLDKVRGLDSPAARLITATHTDPRVVKRVEADHLVAWDDTIALCLYDPALCTVKPLYEQFPVFAFVKWKKTAAQATYYKLLSGGEADKPAE